MACYREIDETAWPWLWFAVYHAHAYFVDSSGQHRAYRADLPDVAAAATIFDAGVGPNGSNRITSIAADDQERVVVVVRIPSFNSCLGVSGPAYAVFRIDDPTTATPSDFNHLYTSSGLSPIAVAWGHDAGVMYLSRSVGFYSIDVDTGTLTTLSTDGNGMGTVTVDGAVWRTKFPFEIERFDPILNSSATASVADGTSMWSGFIPRADASVSAQVTIAAGDGRAEVNVTPALVVSDDPCMDDNTARAFSSAFALVSGTTYHATSGSGGGTPYPAVYEWGAQAWHVGHFYHRG